MLQLLSSQQGCKMTNDLLHDSGAEFQAAAERGAEITASFISTGFWTHNRKGEVLATQKSEAVCTLRQPQWKRTQTKPPNKSSQSHSCTYLK